MRTLVFLALLPLLTGEASAHAFLQHADPGAGAELKVAPKQIALTFSEKLEPAASGISVTDQHGGEMEASAATISDTTITVMLKPLSEGNYRVAWHAVSMDSHRTEGSYSFKVGDRD